LASLTATVTEFVAYGETPIGQRVDVYFEGDLTGGVLSGKMRGIDYILICPGGFSEINARAAIVTDDGASISAQIFGYVRDGEIRDAHVRLLTGDERYRWLCEKTIVGRGKLPSPTQIEVDYFYEP
jgi:hypothetical protein